MKAKLLVAMLASMSLAGSARATMVAGWDFSQYFGAGFLSTDGATFQTTLDANYSDLDPTFNAGAESAAYGTMYIDGTFGSTPVTPGTGTEEIIPFTGSLSSNLGAPILNPFDSHTILASEGQIFTEFLSLGANSGAAGVVAFEADLASAGLTGDTWSLTFGGQTLGGNAQVSVEVAFDGGAFSSLGNANLTAVDTLFTFALGAGSAQAVQVRLGLDSLTTVSLLDNVAISAGNIVPEPGTGMLLVSGLMGLAVMGRRRA